MSSPWKYCLFWLHLKLSYCCLLFCILHLSIFETKISGLSLYLIGFLSDETLETCSQSFLSPSIRGAIISMGCFSLQRKSDSYLIFGLTKPPPLLKPQKSHKKPSLHALQCFEHIIFVWTRYCCLVTILTKTLPRANICIKYQYF